ncbi:hypothetical protein INT48_002492 [Thamnidium elegans]|uniref:Transcription factor domain-containing protein n=1 Tax=Thamnidium elegans TaxID=101142 RepID=A0A8H7T127_9FUNG|nr:hypothetical protein INT48_002492 [Thamnidium elegans]
MLEQIRIMEQDMAAMEQQLRLLNVKVQVDSPTSFFSSEYDSDTNSSSSQSYSCCSESECNNPSYCIHNKRTKYATALPSPSSSSSTALVTSTDKTHWQLTLSQDSKGISFQTSIKNIADVAVFLTESLRYFTFSPERTPNYHADRSHQSLVVTNKKLKVEYVLHSFFQKKKKEIKLNYAPILCDSATRSYLKIQLIRSYFTCAGLNTPIFCLPYFLPLLESQPNCMTAAAVAAYITYSQCRHVVQIPYPLTREGLAESFRQEAKDLLEDILFEEEPSVMIAGSLMLLSQCALITLQNIEARLYMNLAWRMVIQLKDKYLPIIKHVTSDTPVTPEIAIAESWRRLFYAVRYLELNLYIIYDELADFSSILFDNGIGYPTVLATEKGIKDVNDAISVFHHVVRLHNCQMSTNSDELKYQLFAGNLDSISIHDIEQLENQLINFWKTLPGQFRLSDSPLEYLQTDRIQQCENPYAIYLNQLYYAYWMALETRLMRSPATTDLLGANMERFDGDRALLIVSVCCDAISKIFHVLFCRLPCTVELHWLLIASDAMAMLKKAANPHIKSRAQKNLRVTLRVLKDRVQHVNQDSTHNEDYMLWKSMLPAGSPETSMSTSTSSGSLAESEADSIYTDDDGSCNSSIRPPAAYFGELKKALNTYFAGYEQPPT